jgi:hypothetical protein
LIEITAAEANPENLFKLSKGYTWPIVIRGLLSNSTTLNAWRDPDWWMSKYANETVLCGTLAEVVEDCTIGTFFRELHNKRPFYISGASNIFDRNEELHDMIDSEHIRSIEVRVQFMLLLPSLLELIPLEYACQKGAYPQQ